VMRAAAAGAWRDEPALGLAGDAPGTGMGAGSGTTSTTAPGADGGAATAAEVPLCAPGRMRDGRAAFHWCLRKCRAKPSALEDAPDVGPGSCCPPCHRHAF